MKLYKVSKFFYVEAGNADDAIMRTMAACTCCIANAIQAEPATREELKELEEADRLSEEAEQRFLKERPDLEGED